MIFLKILVITFGGFILFVLVVRALVIFLAGTPSTFNELVFPKR